MAKARRQAARLRLSGLVRNIDPFVLLLSQDIAEPSRVVAHVCLALSSDQGETPEDAKPTRSLVLRRRDDQV
jgi:hypothetical protein